MFISNPKARRYFTLVTPETILYRWKKAITNHWAYDKMGIRKKGRPPITKATRLLIKKMKIDSYLWGSKRIQDELKKISIDVSRETIGNQEISNPTIPGADFLNPTGSLYSPAISLPLRYLDSRDSMCSSSLSLRAGKIAEMKYFPYEEYPEVLYGVL